METIVINGFKWDKFVGDEGQDVLVAHSLVPADKILGEYPSEEMFDLVIDKDTDLYLPVEGMSDEDLHEDRIAFKFRKDVFTSAEQKGCYEGLYDAAVESNNRGLAAGPREETQSGRVWFTGFQQDVLRWYEEGQPPNVDGSDPLD